MKLHFLGANRQVTGSRYCLEVNGTKVLVDCGMFQERAYLERNWERNPIPPEEIDALLLTHVHIDHVGLIPRLARNGFSGPIYCTRPSLLLADILLRDSAEIQMEDVEFKKKRHAKEGRQGKHPVIPLYTVSDVEQVLPNFQGVSYGQPLQLSKSVTARFFDAGHILGSAMLELTTTENGQTRKILFSGDVGQWDKPLIRDPTLFEQADYVVMESTYGSRNHENGGDIETQLADVINRTVQRGGSVIIPTFAVERAQELMYYIGRLVHDQRVPQTKVFLDSPMAVDVTEIFQKSQDCLDAETWELILSNQAPLRFPGLELVRAGSASRAINKIKQPCIVMATSGMCTAGRIKHHLKHHIHKANSTILFVGYQGRGTLGRIILDGTKEVRIHGRMYQVAAEIAQIHGFSGHADRDGLLRWLGNLGSSPRQVFLTHGEEDEAEDLAETIRKTHEYDVSVPHYQDVVALT
jgi:metallo-beta-lactamase family protein